jgi:hypothetical protein
MAFFSIYKYEPTAKNRVPNVDELHISQIPRQNHPVEFTGAQRDPCQASLVPAGSPSDLTGLFLSLLQFQTARTHMTPMDHGNRRSVSTAVQLRVLGRVLGSGYTAIVAEHSRTIHGTAQHSTAQYSTTHRSTARHSSTALRYMIYRNEAQHTTAQETNRSVPP